MSIIHSLLNSSFINMGTVQRMFWLSVYIGLISYIIITLMTLWNQFTLHPTVTTMVSSTYPVTDMPFPGISICSINKISKARVHNLALKISNLTKSQLEEIQTFMRFMGQLYDFDYSAAELRKILKFQNILDNMLKMSIIEITKQIAPPCEELVQRCLWRGIQVNCSNIFLMRLTYQGYCCVFNYVKMTEDLQNNETDKEPVTTDAGIENGLYVAVNNNLSDYFYTVFSSPGVMIHIFVPTDYPDKSSGGLTEIITQPNSENFIEVVPTALTSVQEVAQYSVDKRECLFGWEQKLENFNGVYSQSNCNVECRMLSIQAMCQCIPFTMPFSKNSTVCTLADIPCLSRYRDKWNSFFPLDDVKPFLERERQNSLRCDTRCYSACAAIVYDATISSFPIFNKSDEVSNITHLNFYYPYRYSKLYRQDVVYYWFEVLSSFGGIFGIFVGWSLISMIWFFFSYSRKVVWKLIILFF